MDVATIDQQYQQLQSQAQETIQEIRDLAGKLSDAAKAGNQDAKEWLLDLKSVALAIQAEQNQVGLLLQALHGFAANQGQALAQVPQQGPWGGSPQPGMGMGGGLPGRLWRAGHGRRNGGNAGRLAQLRVRPRDGDGPRLRARGRSHQQDILIALAKPRRLSPAEKSLAGLRPLALVLEPVTPLTQKNQFKTTD